MCHNIKRRFNWGLKLLLFFLISSFRGSTENSGQKLGIEAITEAQGLSTIVYFSPQHATEGQDQREHDSIALVYIEITAAWLMQGNVEQNSTDPCPLPPMLPRDTSLGSLGDKACSIGLWRNHNVSRGLEHRLQPFFLLYACIVTIDSRRDGLHICTVEKCKPIDVQRVQRIDLWHKYHAVSSTVQYKTTYKNLDFFKLAQKGSFVCNVKWDCCCFK